MFIVTDLVSLIQSDQSVSALETLDSLGFINSCGKQFFLSVLAEAKADHIRESPAQFENRIMARVNVRRIMRSTTLCTKKLHFVSRNWRMEN